MTDLYPPEARQYLKAQAAQHRRAWMAALPARIGNHGDFVVNVDHEAIEEAETGTHVLDLARIPIGTSVPDILDRVVRQYE